MVTKITTSNRADDRTAVRGLSGKIALKTLVKQVNFLKCNTRLAPAPLKPSRKSILLLFNQEFKLRHV